MTSSRSRRLLAGLCLAGLLAGAARAQITDVAPPVLVPDAPVIPAGAAWANKALPPAQRAADVLAAMTQDEKISLLSGADPMAALNAKQALVPEALPGSGFVAGVPRLGIPPLRQTEGPSGVADPSRATASDIVAFPGSLSLAASFDPALAKQAGAALGAEARVKSFNLIHVGDAATFDDPKSGAGFLGFGADPLLAGTMAGQVVAGAQSNRIIAALGQGVGAAQAIAVATGHPAAVIGHGGPVPASAFVLARAPLTATQAAAAGVDQVVAPGADIRAAYGDQLRAALASGAIGAAQLDAMTLHVLTGLFASGAVDAPLFSPNRVNRDADHDLAAQIAGEGMALLKNTSGRAPLADAKSIGVIGALGSTGVMSGGGPSQVYPGGTVKGGLDYAPDAYLLPSSPIGMLEDEGGADRLHYNPGTDPAAAAAFAKTVDVPVVFVGQWSDGATPRASLALQGGQDAVIAAVAAANPRTVVVIQSGGPVLMPWIGQVSTVLEAWYPGAEGGRAIADILLGKVGPSGRLPVAFPADDAGGGPPLFAFGHGLTYTRFAYKGLTAKGGASLSASFTLSNTGKSDGVETPQLYVASPGGAPKLAAFSRVALKAGQSRSVTLTADPRILAGADGAVAAGVYVISVGPEMGADSLKGSATLTAASIRP